MLLGSHTAALGFRPSAPRAGRRVVAETLGSWGLHREIEAVQICASELLADALLHGQPPLHLVIRHWTDCVQVAVLDGAQHHRQDTDRGAGEESDLRRRIVAALAGDWEFESVPTGTSTWFHLAISPTRTAGPPNRRASPHASAIVGESDNIVRLLPRDRNRSPRRWRPSQLSD